MREGFILYHENYSQVQFLTQEQKGTLLDALFRFSMGDHIPELDQMTSVVFSVFKAKIERDAEKYADRCRKNAENGALGGRPKKRMVTEKSEGFSEKPNETEWFLKKPTKTKTKTKTETIKESTRFAPPSIDDVRSYCTEKGYQIDPEAFVDFYSSKGWKVGNQAMKDWKAAVRTWAKREKPKKAEYHNRYNDFPQRNNDYEAIQAEWIRKEFGA